MNKRVRKGGLWTVLAIIVYPFFWLSLLWCDWLLWSLRVNTWSNLRADSRERLQF